MDIYVYIYFLVAIIIEKLLKLENGDKMEDKKDKEEYIKSFDEIMNIGNELKRFNKEVLNDIKEKEKNSYFQLKKDLLDNLNIANKMFDKYSDIIFNDKELKLKAKEIYEKLTRNFNSY